MYIDYFLKVFAYGPFFLIILSWFLLWNKNTLFFYYTVGLFLDTILNLVLKGIFKHPRPSEDPQKFNLAITHGKRFLFKDGMPYDIFGMPSGHSQSVLFSTVFMYFALKDKKMIYIYAIISLLTMFQRIYSYNHTLFQAIIGAFIGSIVGYLMFFFIRSKINRYYNRKIG